MPGRVSVGDKLLVYVGGAGIIAECTIARALYEDQDSGRDWNHEGKTYPYRIGIEVIPKTLLFSVARSSPAAASPLRRSG